MCVFIHELFCCISRLDSKVQVYRKTVSAKVTLEKENKKTKNKLEHVKIQSKQLLKIKQELEEERDRAVTR